MKEKWVLTQPAFESLLKWLDPDPEEAGKKYETIQRGLITLFTCRSCSEPEKLADEVIDRVAKKLPSIQDGFIGKPESYFYGVAQNVHLESIRRRTPSQELDPSIPAPPFHDEVEAIHECLERCLNKLTPKNKSLILQYYQNEKKQKIKNRDQLAQQNGVGLGNLRIKVYRIRMTLQTCVKKCQEKEL
jgi:DNA-directed RNA polymerase specialized sigma24 family protein